MPTRNVVLTDHQAALVESLVAGGRYDGLMTQLGAATPIPAVGFSVWVETLTQAGHGQAATKSGRSPS